MSEPFIDVVIGPLDETESFKRSGPWWEKVYHLQPVPSQAWAAEFTRVWAGAEYTPKRHARIEKGQLLTVCLLEELQGEHWDYLVAAVARTNAIYRASLTSGA